MLLDWYENWEMIIGFYTMEIMVNCDYCCDDWERVGNKRVMMRIVFSENEGIKIVEIDYKIIDNFKEFCCKGEKWGNSFRGKCG